MNAGPSNALPLPLDAATILEPQMTGAEMVWEALTREGVDTIFGYPGGCVMPLYDALPRYAIHHVLVRHEQGAAHMADGYARASGKVGVALATSGPGATNLVTGIATAMLDSIPLVCITGQVPSHLIGTDAFQEVDITGVTLPITKHNYLVTRAEDIGPTLREAFQLAREGRPGPVVVDITKDAQMGRAAFTWPERRARPAHRAEPTPALADTLGAALDLIATAERPLILAGQGIIAAGASDLLQALVDRADIPVACTLLGLGALPTSDPRHLGMLGMHGEAWVNRAVQRADLIIALGMRFDDRVTGRLATFAPRARKIHVELDPAEVNKNVRVDVPIVGDVAAVLRELLPRLPERRCTAWRADIDAARADSRRRDIIATPPRDGRLYGAQVLHDLWRATEGKALIVSDVGQHQMWEAQYYHHDTPRSLLTSGGLGTMGFALPAAIGAKLARPDDEVWVVVGDGGFQMTAAELSTCAQEGLNINVAIINNGYLGMVRQWQALFFEGREIATPIGQPDFAKLSEAHGLPGLRVERREGVLPAIERARRHPGTVVIDFRVVQQDIVYPMVPAGADLDDMLRRPDAGEEA